MNTEYARNAAVVSVVSRRLADAINGAIESVEDRSDAAAVVGAIYENVAEASIGMLLTTRGATLRAGARAIVTLSDAASLSAVEHGHAGEWLEGFSTAVDMCLAVFDETRDREADSLEYAAESAVANLASVLGPIPPEVADWLTTMLTDRLLDPIGWLRGQVTEVLG